MSILSNSLINDLKGLKAALPNPATVIDIGPGIRPADWFAFKPLCIEPCGVYADILEENGFEVIRKTARQGIRDTMKVDLILMLDVIEHMTMEEGRDLLPFLIGKGKVVVIYTPYGFVEQDKDEWGLGQHEWQTHRSGWLPGAFPGWKIIRGDEGFAAVYPNH